MIPLTIPRRSRFVIVAVFIAVVFTIFHFTDDITASFATTRGASIAATSEADNDEILLVSAYFPMSTSSSTSRLEYETSLQKMSAFLGTITTEVYFYTSVDFASTVGRLRGRLPITINTSFESPFDIPALGGRRSDYIAMANDSQVVETVAHEYAFSNAKPHLLAEAVRVARTSKATMHKYAFWVDADSFDKTHAYRNWPGLDRLDEVWTDGRRESGARLEDMLFIPMWDLPKVDFLLWKEEKGPIEQEFSEDSLFGGMPKSVLWFERFYYAYLDYYLDRGYHAVGQNGALVNSLILLHPENFITVWHGDPAAPSALYNATGVYEKGTDHILGDCGDPNHYHQFFLASSAERSASRAIWNNVWNWRFWDFGKWRLSQPGETCRLTGILAMEWTLRRRFGDMWRSPAASVAFKF